MTSICKGCQHDWEAHEPRDGYAGRVRCGTEGCYCDFFRLRAKATPIRGARLNATYCLVRLSYFQAQQLFLAADPQRTDRDNGWKDIERKALGEALAKLRETSERWPQGMDV